MFLKIFHPANLILILEPRCKIYAFLCFVQLLQSTSASKVVLTKYILTFVDGTDFINRHLFLRASKKLNARFALFIVIN